MISNQRSLYVKLQNHCENWIWVFNRSNNLKFRWNSKKKKMFFLCTFLFCFFACIMISSVPDIGGLDLSISFFCSCSLAFFHSCSFSFLLTFYFCRCWLAPYPLHSALAFLRVCFREPKKVCNQAFLLRATERERKDERDRNATGSIVRCDCWRGASLFDTQSKHVWWTPTIGIGRTWIGQKLVFGIWTQMKRTWK